MKYFCALSSWLSPCVSWVWAAFPTGVSASTKVHSFWHSPWWKAVVSARFVKQKCNSAKKKLGWWLTRVTLPFCEFFLVWSLQAPSTWVYPKPPLFCWAMAALKGLGCPQGHHQCGTSEAFGSFQLLRKYCGVAKVWLWEMGHPA